MDKKLSNEKVASRLLAPTMDPYHGGQHGHAAHNGHGVHGSHGGHGGHGSHGGHGGHGGGGGHRSMMDRGLYKMGGRLPVTTYYRTMSIDNKPTTVIIGPSKLSVSKVSTKYFATISTILLFLLQKYREISLTPLSHSLDGFSCTGKKKSK